MKTKTVLSVFILFSAIFLVNTLGKEKPTSEKKPFKWNAKNWIIEGKEPNSKDVLVKDRVRRHLFKGSQRPQYQPPVVIINRYSEENSGWAPPPPPPTRGWTTTTTTTTTTTPRPTTTRGWSPPPPPPPQNGWGGGGGHRQEISGGNSWSINHGHGGIIGFPHRVIQSGLEIFKKSIPEDDSDEYETKTFGISIFKGKQKY